MRIESFKELTVWQKSMDLAREIYRVSDQLPKSETFGLVSQMRRCAVSIPSNVAEGRQRGARKDFIQFLRIASGSAAELETQLMLSQQLYRNASLTRSFSLLEEVQKMLSVMAKRLSAVADVSKSYKLKAKS